MVQGALKGGCRAIQLRDKGASARELMEVGTHLRRMTREQDALLFVNDRLDVALALEADGVHLGPDDIPVKAVRAVAPPHLLVGYSTDIPGEAAAGIAVMGTVMQAPDPEAEVRALLSLLSRGVAPG